LAVARIQILIGLFLQDNPLSIYRAKALMWIGQRSDINCGAAGKKKLITDRQRVLKGAPADQFAG
jgi:hypothetical protein